MRAFTVAFANVLSSHISFRSISSVVNNFDNIDIVTDTYVLQLYDDKVKQHIKLLNSSCPISWKQRKECLILNYLNQTEGNADLLYFDLDIFMTPGSRVLFENIFKWYTFDVSYTHRGFKSRWGIVNTGIILFRNTKQTRDWLHAFYAIAINSTDDPQITIDSLIHITVQKIFVPFYVDGTQFLLLPSKPYNMLSKWENCKKRSTSLSRSLQTKPLEMRD